VLEAGGSIGGSGVGVVGVGVTELGSEKRCCHEPAH